MSDDRPAIVVLNDTLKKYKISREEVSMLNQIKLDLICPEEEDESKGATRFYGVHDEASSSTSQKVHEETDEEGGKTGC